MRFVPTAVVAAALLACAAQVSAQSAREALAERVDSLAAEYVRQLSIVSRLDSIETADAAQIRADTVFVRPFLIVDRDTVDVTAVARALADAWQARTALLGVAAERIDDVVVTVTLEADLMKSEGAARVHVFEPFVTGSADFPRAAERIVSAVLTAALPDDIRDWLGGASLQPARGGMEWTYRELATTTEESARRCFHDEIDACRAALGLGIAGELDGTLSAGARATLLAHALEVGGDGSYAQLFAAAPDVIGSLANAAGVPPGELIEGWRDAVQASRPDVRAGLGQTGFWTFVWLTILALLAMRSTRWRLG